MKKMFFTMIVFFLLSVLSACNTPTPVVLTFAQDPTAVTGQAEGQITINAAIEGNLGQIFYVVVAKNATAPTAEQVKAGVSYGTVNVVANGDSGTSKTISNLSLSLTPSTEYTVYFVISYEQALSAVKFANVTAKEAPATLGFTSIALSTGDANGELKINIVKSGSVGTIYYILVTEGSAAPTESQIVSAQNYGTVTIVSSGNSAVFSNHVVDGLVPGARYTLHTVVSFEGRYSMIRSMSASAKEVIDVVNKGSGTEADPFQISTIADLEQIGKGYYVLDEKEWNMDSHYILLNDIDLSSVYGPDKLNWPVLGADSAGARFAGVLDGNGHSISGLYIGPTSTAGVYRGLFAASEHTSVVKNLTFIDAYITGAGINESNTNHGTGVLFGYFKGSVSHISIINATVIDTGSRVGGLTGRSYESGHISHTYVNANVQGHNRVGGIAGVVDVSDTTATPILYQDVVFDGEVIGEYQYVGGIAGYLRGVQMTNVFVTGYIQGAQEVGGVVGFYQKRAGNNNVSAIIENVVVYATVFGTSTTTTIGNIVGQVSTSNITVDNADMLKVQNTYYVEGTQFYNGGDSRSVTGTLVTKADFASTTWLNAQLPTWNFTTTWEIKNGSVRPTLQNTVDLGLLDELSTPLVLIPNVTSGELEKQLQVRITANKPDATIYYVIVATEMTLTAADIKTPVLASILISGHGLSIQDTHMMPAYDTLYYVYYYAEHIDGNTEVMMTSAKSRAMTTLTLSGGLRPGEASKEIVLTLTSNLPSTIYYIIVATESTYTKEQIKTPTDVLFSGNGAEINLSHIMPLEETTYFVYAYAEMSDRSSDVFQTSGLSSSDTYVNYGTGSVADPFIIRTVEDLENIGNISYVNAQSVSLAYVNTAYYQLANDIDLTDKYGEGKLNWTPIPEFFGVLDGQGHTIIGLYINNPTSTTHNGLIGYLRTNAVVKNLTLDHVYIQVKGQVSDGNTGMTGAVAGRMNSSSMENIRITNAVIMTQGFRVGALAGGNEGTNGSLKNIYIEASVTGFARVGGVIGNVSNSSNAPFIFDNIVFIGSVSMMGTSDYRVGGVVGWARGVQVNNAYIEGYIGGVGAYAGGVAGYLENYNDTTQFSQITNTLVNVVVTSSVGRAGALIGNVSSTVSKVPALVNNYQTIQTTMIIPGELHTATRHATPADVSTWTETTFTTNMPGLNTTNGWIWLASGHRPALENTPDSGLIQVLEIPLMVTKNIVKGTQEKEINIQIHTNKSESTIYYVVTTTGSYTATEIQNAVVGETFIKVGSGTAIDVVEVMPLASTSYTVSYVVSMGGILGDVMTQTVMSGDELPLTFVATATTGVTTPGDITLSLTSTSVPSNVYVLVVLEGSDIPLVSDIVATGILLTTEVTINRTPGSSYTAYFYGVKTVGDVHSAVVAIPVVAKAEPIAPFELNTATLVANDIPGELILTLQASHDASIYYLVLLATATEPSQADIESMGTLYTGSPVTLTLTADTTYKVYVVALRTGSSDVATDTLEQTTKRALYNGLQTESYFPIYALEDLEDFRTGMNAAVYSNTASIVFFVDIDFSTTYGSGLLSWVPIGTNARKYKGLVEGNNHILNGLYIYNIQTTIDMNEGTGLFGTTDNGFGIQNIHFTNVNITGSIAVGVIAGYSKITLMTNVSVDGGTVTALNEADSRVGGLIGRLNANTTTNSIIEKAWTNVTVSGFKHVGGLIGHVDYSSDTALGEIIIRDVYTLGAVTSPLASSANVGGVIGYNRGTLIRAIAYGTVTNPSSASGGVVGYLQTRKSTTPSAKVMDSIASNMHTKVVGQVSTTNGEPVVTNNLLVVAENPIAEQILMADLLNTTLWGTTIPLNTTDWEVVNDKAVLKKINLTE